MGGLAIGVLGPLEVLAPGAVALTRPTHRRLLTILLLGGGRRISRDQLIDRFWTDDPPPSARAALQTHIAAVRKLLPAGLIVTEAMGYSIDLSGHRVDAHEFDRLAVDAHRAAQVADWAAVRSGADHALGLWRGEPFDELIYDDFAAPERTRLHGVSEALIELRLRALVELGEAVIALPDLERAVVEQPLREVRWELLARARHHAGRQAEALRAIRDARDALADAGLEPGAALRSLEQEILFDDSSGPARARRHNLPEPLTSFIGRDDAKRHVGELVDAHRLVTLTGPGGAGKTRLALEAARDRWLTSDADCWFVDLAPLRDGSLIAEAIVTMLDAHHAERDAAQTLRFLAASSQVLLVLDNCEHLLDDAARMARFLLESGVGVRILATSRTPLGVPGELIEEVPPLATPSAGDPIDVVERCDAIRLFVERALLVRPQLRLGRDEFETIGEICRRLDGLPLAIELAAARIRSLGLTTIAHRLDDRLSMLVAGGSTGPERHRTQAATIAWSYDLLSPDEQRHLARLSVFHGDFDAEAAANVGATAPVINPIDALGHLVDQSLVAARDRSAGRYFRLLETIREFAAERLSSANETAATRQRHRQWFASKCSDLEWARIHYLGLPPWVALAEDDLRAALLDGRTDAGRACVGPLAAILGFLAAERGRIEASIEYLEESIASDLNTGQEVVVRARLASQRFRNNESDEAFLQASIAADMVSRLPPSAATVQALMTLANLQMLLTDRSSNDAVPLAQRALELADADGDTTLRYRAASSLADALGWSGDTAESIRVRTRARQLALESGDTSLIIDAYVASIGSVYVTSTDRRAGARMLMDELFSVVDEDDPVIARHDNWPVFAALQLGDLERAERLLATTDQAHLEGFDETGQLIARAIWAWLRGTPELGEDYIDRLFARGINPRWFHDCYPVAAEIATDLGLLGRVRRLADEFLSFPVDPTEEANKLAVLRPLVRAEIDAALAADDEATRRRHQRCAAATVETMRDHLARHPPVLAGSLQLEVPATYLALAEAELSRLEGGEEAVAAWRAAAILPDYEAIRTYAEQRLAEATERTVTDVSPRAER